MAKVDDLSKTLADWKRQGYRGLKVADVCKFLKKLGCAESTNGNGHTAERVISKGELKLSFLANREYVGQQKFNDVIKFCEAVLSSAEAMLETIGIQEVASYKDIPELRIEFTVRADEDIEFRKQQELRNAEKLVVQYRSKLSSLIDDYGFSVHRANGVVSYHSSDLDLNGKVNFNECAPTQVLQVLSGILERAEKVMESRLNLLESFTSHGGVVTETQDNAITLTPPKGCGNKVVIKTFGEAGFFKLKEAQQIQSLIKKINEVQSGEVKVEGKGALPAAQQVNLTEGGAKAGVRGRKQEPKVENWGCSRKVVTSSMHLSQKEMEAKNKLFMYMSAFYPLYKDDKQKELLSKEDLVGLIKVDMRKIGVAERVVDDFINPKIRIRPSLWHGDKAKLEEKVHKFFEDRVSPEKLDNVMRKANGALKVLTNGAEKLKKGHDRE